MYNIYSHYVNIFESLKSVTKHRRLIYLLPYGSTSASNIEMMSDNVAKYGGRINEGPLFIFYDQEPIYGTYNYELFDYIQNKFQPPFILVTTEKNSKPLNLIKEKYKWPVVYYFHHIFAAADWFRGYQFNQGITDPKTRVLEKKFITFNRITGSSRVYRSFLIAELQKRNLIDEGFVSYSKDCPVHGSFKDNILKSINDFGVPADYANNCIQLIDSIDTSLRIDQQSDIIENDSQSIGPVHQLMNSFLYLVTETCFWEQKCHLTEKIFKPIVAQQPFLLLGPAHNLEYLKSYGFKTFDRWWDESYDAIEDPIERLHAVLDILEKICSKSIAELTQMLHEMTEVLEFNQQHFYSNNLISAAWDELITNIQDSVVQLPPPTLSGIEFQKHLDNLTRIPRG